MLAFTGCDKFHKTISGLQNEAEVKEVLNDKTDVKEVVKAEHYTVGDALHLAVSSYFFFSENGNKGKFECIWYLPWTWSSCYMLFTDQSLKVKLRVIMKKLVAISIIAMMLFSSCGKSPSLLEPKQTEVVESPEEMYPGAGITYKDLGVVALVYLVGMPLFSFLKECVLNQRAFRFKNNTPYMLVNPYASPPYHYVEVVNYKKNTKPGPVASLNIGTKVDGEPVLERNKRQYPKPV